MKMSNDSYQNFVDETWPLVQKVAKSESIPLINMPVNDMSDFHFSGYNKTKLMLSSMANGFGDHRWFTEKQLAEKHPELSIPENAKPTMILRSEKYYYELDGEGSHKPLTKEEFDSRRLQASEQGEKANAHYAFNHSLYNVYNASQVPDYPKFEHTALTKQDTHELIENFVASSGIKVVQHNGEHSNYNPSKDCIEMNPSHFASKDEYYTKLLANYFLATSHPDREHRTVESMNDVFAENVKANMFALMASAHLGLDNTQKHAQNLEKLITDSSYSSEQVMKASYDANKMMSTLEQYYTGDTIKAHWFPHNTEWADLVQNAKQEKELSQKDLSQKDEQEIQGQAVFLAPKSNAKSIQAEHEIGTSHAIVLRIYLDVPKAQKEEAKALGAKWDNDEKSWFTLNNNPNNDKLFEKWKINEEVQANKIYLNVPKEEKDDAKALGAMWDNHLKAWYTTKDNPNNDELLKNWGSSQNQKPSEDKIFLSVSLAEKDEAKALGAKWDSQSKMWYTTAGNPNNQELFEKWSATDKPKEKQTAQERIYLNVPIEEKDDAKAFGAKWDKKAIAWYTTSENPQNEALFSLYTKQNSTPLSAKELEKAQAMLNDQKFLDTVGNSKQVQEAIATLNNAINMVSNKQSRPKMGSS